MTTKTKPDVTLGLIPKILDQNKVIKKSKGEIFMRKLYKRYPKAIDEIASCKDELKKLDA